MTFRYRALTPNGEVVSGSISAPTAAEVAERVEYLGLIPIETVRDEGGTGGTNWDFALLSRPRPEDVTIFTGDLALLLQTGARINDALELLAADADIGRLRPTVAKLTAAILSGESFADALAHHPALFPPMYVELARVGETSGTLVNILEVLGAERVRAEALRRRFTDALRYPAFVLAAASCGAFVLSHFRAAAVWRGFARFQRQARSRHACLSSLFRSFCGPIPRRSAWPSPFLAAAAGFFCDAPRCAARSWEALARLPFIGRVLEFHRTSVFCRNLGVLLASGVPAGDDAADSRRFDGDDRALRRLGRNRRYRPPRRQAVRRARQDAGCAADGRPHLAAWRRVRVNCPCSRKELQSFTKLNFNAASTSWLASPVPSPSSGSASLSAA